MTRHKRPEHAGTTPEQARRVERARLEERPPLALQHLGGEGARQSIGRQPGPLVVQAATPPHRGRRAGRPRRSRGARGRARRRRSASTAARRCASGTAGVAVEDAGRSGGGVARGAPAPAALGCRPGRGPPARSAAALGHATLLGGDERVGERGRVAVTEHHTRPAQHVAEPGGAVREAQASQATGPDRLLEAVGGELDDGIGQRAPRRRRARRRRRSRPSPRRPRAPRRARRSTHP